MRRNRQGKITATLAPASSSPEVIRTLSDAGADVYRFTFSHGSQQEYRRCHAIVRETGRPIAVLADLQGPKLRVGTLAAGSPSTLNAAPEAAAGCGRALLRTHDYVRIDLAKGEANILIPDAELAEPRVALEAQAGFRFPTSRMPWREIYRSTVGQLSSGGSVELATNYLDITTSTSLCVTASGLIRTDGAMS
jgi:hypothetical protein